MKKHAKEIATVLLMLVSTQILTSCFGKFALVNKLYDWNGTIENKFVKSLVFWVLIIIPVYQFASLADFIVLNLIEFWSGSNPMAMAPGQIERQYVMHKGKNYLLVAEYNKMTISELDVKGNAVKTQVLHFNPENSIVQLETPNGLVKVADYSESNLVSNQSLKIDVQGI